VNRRAFVLGAAMVLLGNLVAIALRSFAEAAFLEVLDELLAAAQRAGTVRTDVGAAELKALLMVCKSTQEHGDGVADRVACVIVDGLRTMS